MPKSERSTYATFALIFSIEYEPNQVEPPQHSMSSVESSHAQGSALHFVDSPSLDSSQQLYVDTLAGASTLAESFLVSLPMRSRQNPVTVSPLPHFTYDINRGVQNEQRNRGRLVPSVHILSRRRRTLMDREEFIVFVKILLKCLTRSGEEKLHRKCTNTLKQCILQNRMGEDEYSPLHHVGEERLHQCVGDQIYDRAKSLVRRFLKRQGLEKVTEV